jgi:hypothetical protein
MQEPTALIDAEAAGLILAEFKRLLAEEIDPIRIKDVRDKADALQQYFRKACIGFEMQNQAAEMRLRAQRSLGQILADSHLRGGDRRSNRPWGGLKLADIGMTEKQSRRWQKEAQVHQDVFEEYIRWSNEERKELTSNGLLRAWARVSGNGNGKGREEKSGIAQSRGKRDLSESLEEICNHTQTVDGVLAAFYRGDIEQLTVADGRFVQRAMQEIAQLAEEVRMRLLEQG